MISLRDRIINDVENKYQITCAFQKNIPGGWKNQKWLVHSSVGSLVIKELSNERYSKKRLKEVEKALTIQWQLYEKSSIAPKVYKSNNCIVQEIENNHYMVMGYVEGEHKCRKTIQDKDLFLLGKALAEIHSLNPLLAYDDLTIEDDHYGNLQTHIKSLDLSKIKNEQFLNLIKRVRHINKTLSQEFLVDMTIGFVHSDFTKDNMLIGRNYVQILDFDRGRIGYQLQDIGRAIMSYVYDGVTINPNKLNHLITGYKSIRAITREDVYKSLKLSWMIEVTWWFQESYFDDDIKEKLRDFQEEIIWLTDHWENLEELILNNMPRTHSTSRNEYTG